MPGPEMSTPNGQEFNDDRLGRIERIVSGLVVDMGDIKGNIAKYEVARDARLITFDLGVQYLREIERDELARWAQNSPTRESKLGLCVVSGKRTW